MQEIWKDIKDYEGFYQVSNQGRVKSLPRRHTIKEERILKPKLNKNGYLEVSLCKNSKYKTYTVHRLVAEAFIPNPENLPEVNHKKEFEKENNKVSNLEWCSSVYNANYGTRSIRSGKSRAKAVICVETNRKFKSINDASRQTGISKGNIASCCKNKPHCITAGGYHWKYHKDVM